MEPSTRQPDVVMDTLYNEGFLALEDPSVGEAVSELERNGFPFWSEEGLDFVARHIINEPVSSALLSTKLLLTLAVYS